jgi:hypothetical protein
MQLHSTVKACAGNNEQVLQRDETAYLQEWAPRTDKLCLTTILYLASEARLTALGEEALRHHSPRTPGRSSDFRREPNVDRGERNQRDGIICSVYRISVQTRRIHLASATQVASAKMQTKADKEGVHAGYMHGRLDISTSSLRRATTQYVFSKPDDNLIMKHAERARARWPGARVMRFICFVRRRLTGSPGVSCCASLSVVQSFAPSS